MMAQRALKQKADYQGLQLRPQDPNVAVPGKSSNAILGAGSKRARSGAASAGAVRGGVKGGDPLVKKVKVRPSRGRKGRREGGCAGVVAVA